MSEEIKVGSKIIVLHGTQNFIKREYIGKIATVVEIDTSGIKDGLPYKVNFEGNKNIWWANGVPLTSLLKELF